jgi:hypothetical protein
MWRATTKIWRGLSKFTIWRVVGGRDFGATVPLQTGNELFGEARGLALMPGYQVVASSGAGKW